jgi:hypothetical protein
VLPAIYMYTTEEDVASGVASVSVHMYVTVIYRVVTFINIRPLLCCWLNMRRYEMKDRLLLPKPYIGLYVYDIHVYVSELSDVA